MHGINRHVTMGEHGSDRTETVIKKEAHPASERSCNVTSHPNLQAMWSGGWSEGAELSIPPRDHSSSVPRGYFLLADCNVYSVTFILVAQRDDTLLRNHVVNIVKHAQERH